MTGLSTPEIKAFFDPKTFTVSYVVADLETKLCAIIDSVLDYNAEAGHTSTESADKLINFIHEKGYKNEWIIETHVHADHLSAAPYLKEKLGGKLAIGNYVNVVQKTFGPIFNAEKTFQTDGRQFDHLFANDEIFKIGNIEAKVLHTPGHTPACVSYVIGNACFVGDTLFMPDYGTARCDFPGGDAAKLYDSIQRILALPDDTVLYMCHDYAPNGRDYKWTTTVKEQKEYNIHIAGKNKSQYVNARNARDKELGMPKLIIPSVQVNMRAGHFPPADNNGKTYLKIPVNTL